MDLGVYGAPETFLINSDGIIKARHVGALTPESLGHKKFVSPFKMKALIFFNNSY